MIIIIGDYLLLILINMLNNFIGGPTLNLFTTPSVVSQVVLGALIDALEQCQEAATEAEAAAAAALIKQHKETLEAPQKVGKSPWK